MNTRNKDIARTEAGLEQDSVTLFDIAVPASGVRATENRFRVVRTVDPVSVTGAEAISTSNGWDRDTCYAAAWVMVLSRILGEEEVDLYTWEQEGSTSGSWHIPRIAFRTASQSKAGSTFLPMTVSGRIRPSETSRYQAVLIISGCPTVSQVRTIRQAKP